MIGSLKLLPDEVALSPETVHEGYCPFACLLFLSLNINRVIQVAAQLHEIGKSAFHLFALGTLTFELFMHRIELAVVNDGRDSTNRMLALSGCDIVLISQPTEVLAALGVRPVRVHDGGLLN